MLYEFLEAERVGILALCEKKLAQLADLRSSSGEMEKGLPIFYDELIAVLRADEENGHTKSNDTTTQSIH